MSDEDQMVPQDQAESVSTPESEPAAEPDTDAPETGTEQPDDSEPKAEPEKTEEPKAKQPWYERRLGQQSAKIADLARRNEELERLNAERASVRDEQSAEGKSIRPEDIDRIVEQRAAERIAAQERAVSERSFNEACNRTFSAGTSDFPDFQTAVGTLQAMGALAPENVQIVLDAAGENAHKALYQLGKNPDEAERIFSLPPIRMAVELSKLGASAPGKQPPPLSKAPDPIKPISGNAAVNVDDAKMSDDEWWRRYNSR